MPLFYSLADAESSLGTTMPDGTDVGYFLLEYHKKTSEENPTRERIGMITNGDGTFDYAYAVYNSDGTYTDAALLEGLDDSVWATRFKTIQGFQYVINMTRAEFNDFVTAIGV